MFMYGILSEYMPLYGTLLEDMALYAPCGSINMALCGAVYVCHLAEVYKCGSVLTLYGACICMHNGR